jgi:hypothetical protein
MAEAHALLGDAPTFGANAVVGLRQRLREGGGDHLGTGFRMGLHLDACHLEFVDARGPHQDVPGGGRLARSARTRAFRTFTQHRAFDVRAGLEVFGDFGLRIALGLLLLLIPALRLRVLRNDALTPAALGIVVSMRFFLVTLVVATLLVATLALFTLFALLVVVSILGHRGHSWLE